MAAAGVAAVAADAEPRRCCLPSAWINTLFHLISSSVRQRLAPGSKLPYSICGSHGAGLSQTMTWRLSKRSNFARIQRKRVSTKQRVTGSGDACKSRKHRSS